jgi:septum formation protein
MKLILGSQSKWRKDILERMGYEFDVMISGIDEKAIRLDDPKKLALALANAKADEILPKIQGDAILITSDQVEFCNGEIREKPKDANQAKEFLHSYNKYPVEAITGVVVVNTVNKKRKEGIDVVKVYFNPLSEEKIEELVSDGCVLTGAGGFLINHPLFKGLIKEISGERDSVAGLPPKLTKKLIEEVS